MRLQQELNNQYSSNLFVDGLISSNILAACPTVKMNARGNITKLIQERLNSVGFNLVEDKIFGSKTKTISKKLSITARCYCWQEYLGIFIKL